MSREAPIVHHSSTLLRFPALFSIPFHSLLQPLLCHHDRSQSQLTSCILTSDANSFRIELTHALICPCHLPISHCLKRHASSLYHGYIYVEGNDIGHLPKNLAENQVTEQHADVASDSTSWMRKFIPNFFTSNPESFKLGLTVVMKAWATRIRYGQRRL